MSSGKKQTVLGLTGPFGSGCTTVADVLKRDYGFVVYSLSYFVKEKWKEENPGKEISEASRRELQEIGNRLRDKEGHDTLAQKAYNKANEERRLDEKRLVFDSIRNTAEIEYLRKSFHHFYLIAVDCVEGDRWGRVQDFYAGVYQSFRADDRRDKNEECIPYGQQVALCVDESDALIRNDTDPMVTTKIAWMEKISDKMKDFISLFEGKLRSPTEHETYMSMAYSASLMSQCFKRQVGAIIVDSKSKVVSVGYNENPPPLKPCHKEFGDCFREMHIDGLMKDLLFCPNCGEKIQGLKYPYGCPRCQENLYQMVVRDRALSRCSALHAEERAIVNAGASNLAGCTLYVTTFPCFSCAHKILDVGIRTIWYVESYPDVDSLNMFVRAGTVGLQKFEGIKARAYFQLFGQWRREEEKGMLSKRAPPP